MGEATDTNGTSSTTVLLSHDMPCQRCGHAVHTFLACSDACSCLSVGMPGSSLQLAPDPELVLS